MTYSRWLLFAGTLLLPMGLLAQSGLEPTEMGIRNETVRMGMSVFGTVLGIHGTDTLAVQGDVVLINAEVVGEGVLSLCDSQPQRIIAQQSSVQNLHIANPTKVTVEGDLVIRKSLVIEKGVFDSRMATLTLSDTCRVQVGKGAQVRWPESAWLVTQTKVVPQPESASPVMWATMGYELIGCKIGQFLIAKRFSHQPFRWLQKETIPPSLPPEWGIVPLVLSGYTKRPG